MHGRLSEYLRQWHLSDPELLADTATSQVYLVRRDGEPAVLKLLTPVGAEDEADAVFAFHYFAGQGAVRLLAHDAQAHLLEYAGEQELAQLVYQGDDIAAAEIIGDILNALHHPRPDVPIPQLRTVRQRFSSLFSRAAEDAASGQASVYRRGAVVAERLLAHPQDECVLHGDIQHHNICLHPERGWLAFDAKGLYGERLFDATNVLCNPAGAPERVLSEERLLQVSQVLADRMGVDVRRLRAFVFAYACLSASWPDKPEGSEIQRWFLTVAHNAEPHASLTD